MSDLALIGIAHRLEPPLRWPWGSIGPPWGKAGRCKRAWARLAQQP